MGGAIVHLGDIIVGDVYGVVCVPRAHAEAALEMSRETDERDAERANSSSQMALSAKAPPNTVVSDPRATHSLEGKDGGKNPHWWP